MGRYLDGDSDGGSCGRMLISCVGMLIAGGVCLRNIDIGRRKGWNASSGTGKNGKPLGPVSQAVWIYGAVAVLCLAVFLWTWNRSSRF